MRRIKIYVTSFGFDFHACGHYKEKVPVSVDEICEHIPENCFKHKIVVHKSSNSYNRNLLNYLIHKNISLYNFHAVLCSVLSMI